MDQMAHGTRGEDPAGYPLVSSAYVVHDDRVLLVLHSGFGRWVPPGGHMEVGETLSQAARREACEETGLDIELVSASPVIHPADGNATPDVTAFYCDVLVEGFARPVLVHYYWGRVTSVNREPRCQVSEVNRVAWITMEELATLPTFGQVRSLAAYALRHHPDVADHVSP